MKTTVTNNPGVKGNFSIEFGIRLQAMRERPIRYGGGKTHAYLLPVLVDIRHFTLRGEAEGTLLLLHVVVGAEIGDTKRTAWFLERLSGLFQCIDPFYLGDNNPCGMLDDPILEKAFTRLMEVILNEPDSFDGYGTHVLDLLREDRLWGWLILPKPEATD